MQDGFLTVSVIDNTTNSPIVNATINIYSTDSNGTSSTPFVFKN